MRKALYFTVMLCTLSIAILPAQDDPNQLIEEATELANEAEKQVANGEYEKAAENYEKAAEKFREAGMDGQADAEAIKAGSAWENAANAKEAEGEYDEAADLYKKAADAYKDGKSGKASAAEDSAAKCEELAKSPVTATGENSGHIADLTLANDTNEPMSVYFPQGEIPPTGNGQRLVTTEPIEGEVPPNSSKSFRVTGYCVEPWAPDPKYGSRLIHPDAWRYNTPMVTTMQDIVETTTEVINKSPKDFSYLGGPEKAIELVSLYTGWTVTPYDGVTGKDICERIKTDLSTGPNPVITDQNPGAEDVIDRGLLDVLDVVNTVGKELDLPGYETPQLPEFTKDIYEGADPSHPEIANTISVKGTGRTTGHIADLTISNPTDKPVTVHIGKGDLYIPSTGDQPMIVDAIEPISLQPGETVTKPLYGVCGDNSIPVTPNGGSYSNPSSWVGLGESLDGPPLDPTSPGVSRQPRPVPGEDIVSIPTSESLPLDAVQKVLEDIADQSLTSAYPCVNKTLVPKPTIPGTDRPIPVNIDPIEYPGIGISLALHAYDATKRAYNTLVESGVMKTMFSGDPAKEALTYTQWKTWAYNVAQKGGVLQKSSWDETSMHQVSEAIGAPVEQLEEEQKETIVVELDNFWDKINLNTKDPQFLTDVTPPAEQTTTPDNPSNSLTKPGKPGGGTPLTPEGQNELPGETTGPTGRPPYLISVESGDKKCECGEISFDLFTWDAIMTLGGTIEARNRGADSRHNIKTAADGTTETINANRPKQDKHDLQLVSIRNLKISCDCINYDEDLANAVNARDKYKKKYERRIDIRKRDLDKAINSFLKKERDDSTSTAVKLEKAKEALKDYGGSRQSTIENLNNDIKDAQAEYDAANAALKAKKDRLEDLDNFEVNEDASSTEKRKERKVKDEYEDWKELAKPLEDLNKAVDDLKATRTSDDCPAFKDKDEFDESQKDDPPAGIGGKPTIEVDGNFKTAGIGGGVMNLSKPHWDENNPDQFIFTISKDDDPFECTITISYHCGDEPCEATSCSKTFKLVIEEKDGTD